MSIFLVALLIISFILETAVLLVADNKIRNYLLGKPGKGEDNVTREVQKYASNSLNFAAITFIAISLVSTEPEFSKNIASDAITLLIFAISSFIVAFKLEVRSATRRIYLDLQQRFFNFGILAAVYSLPLLFFRIPNVENFIISATFAVIVTTIHLFEYITDYETTKKIVKKSRINIIR